MTRPLRRRPGTLRPVQDADALLQDRAEVFLTARRELKSAVAIGLDMEDIGARKRDYDFARGFLEMSLQQHGKPFTWNQYRFMLDRLGELAVEDLKPERNKKPRRVKK